jgi:beta-galactosidase
MIRATILVLVATGTAACSHPGSGQAPGDAGGPDGAPDAPGPRELIELDDAWKFTRSDVPGAEQVGLDDSGWTAVTLPHTWNALDGQQGGKAYYRGVTWYRRHLPLDARLAGRRLALELDGANLIAEVYVNGQKLGQHQGGYSRFRFDATAQLRPGETNLVAVKLDNAFHADVPPLDADYTFFGGLYRGVRLVVTQPIHISTADHGAAGVYVQTERLDADVADLRITARVQNQGAADADVRVAVRILDADGNGVVGLRADQPLAAGAGADVVQTVRVPRPHRWNGQRDPYLYRVVVQTIDLASGAVTDEVAQSFGLRTCAVDAQRGFLLNGEYLDLHGVNFHQDRLDVGWAISDAQVREDLDLMEEIGATGIRAAHYPHAESFYDLTDRDGMIVWAEIPLINHINDSPEFAASAREQLVELIRQNYNHPSICFWGISNELTLRPGPDPSALQDQLGAGVHDEDPTRLSALASTDAASDRHHTDTIGFNKYFGWYVGNMADFAPWADHIHASEASTPFAVTEYGAGASVQFHSDTPRALDHTEEYQASFHEAHWRALKTRPFIWGKFVWNMFDFASSDRNEGDTPGRNDKGLVTYDRKTRKDAFYFYQANWTDVPFVHIASRRFTPRTRATTSIKVYGTMDTVEVKLNGTSLGSKSGVDGVYTWANVTLAHGANTVEAIGKRGGTTVSDQVTWQLQ